jgi:hypothetical protein
MKKIVIFGVVIAIVLLAGISLAANAENEKVAVNVADKWLTLMDAGKYSESWREANDYFRNSVTQGLWEKFVRSRARHGKVISRKLKTKTYRMAFPGEPQGQYIIIQYKTSFQNKKSVIEEVGTTFDKNGRWRVSGYHLR